MTMPVSTGKNACFGYEDETSSASGGGPHSDELVSRAPAEELMCRGAATTVTSEPTHATEDGCALSPITTRSLGALVLGSSRPARPRSTATVEPLPRAAEGWAAAIGGAAHVGYLRDPSIPATRRTRRRSARSFPACRVGWGWGWAQRGRDTLVGHDGPRDRYLLAPARRNGDARRRHGGDES